MTLFLQWIDTIIQENTNNDQKALNFKKLGAYQVFDCNSFADSIYTAQQSAANVTESNARYCFLNELLFQVSWPLCSTKCVINLTAAALEWQAGLLVCL